MNFLSSFVILIVLGNVFAFDAVAQNTDSTLTVKVKGIGCEKDVKLIETNVEKLKGVNKCKVRKQGAITTFDIQFNPQVTTKKKIDTAIEETGTCENPDNRIYKVKN